MERFIMKPHIQSPSVPVRTITTSLITAGLLLAFASTSLAQNQVSSTLAKEQSPTATTPLTAHTSAEKADEPEAVKPESLQYIRLSDLTGEGNTQYTYTPAKYDPKELSALLHYPKSALSEGKSGKVDIVVYLNAEGKITHMNYIGEPQGGYTPFVRSACDAVSKCAFTPAQRNSKPVHSVIVIPIRFVL